VLDESIGRLPDGHGGAVVLDGAAGLGKTALLEHAMAAAAERGFQVRHAAPGPPERNFQLGVVRALLEAPLRDAGEGERARLLRGPAEQVGSVLLGGANPASGNAMAVAHGVMWLCSALAARQPLVLAVDDAQWADRESLEVLAYLARRVDDLPVLILVAARGADPQAQADVLSLLGGARSGTVLRPQPLTRFGAVRLIRRVAPDASFAVCADCHEAAGGNPWLLDELGRQIATHGPEGAPSLSRAARGSVRARMAALAPAERSVAAALSVVGDRVERRVVATVAGVPAGELAGARDALTAAGLLGASGLRVAHDLIAAAIRDGLSRGDRERLHAEAARALMDLRADDEAVARHLLHCAPAGDPEASALLVRAATAARERGAVRVAGAYLDRALNERAPGDDRGRMLAELATFVFASGCPDARVRLRQALREVGDSEGRVDILTRLAMLNVVDGCDGELSQFLSADAQGDADDDIRLAYEAAALDALITVPERHAERARRVAAIDPSATDDPVLARVFIAHRAWLACELGEPGADHCAELAVQALDGGLLLDEAESRVGFHLCVRALIMCDRTEQAAREIARLRERATARGSRRMLAAAAWYSAEVALRTGHLARAEADSRRALALVDDGPNVVTGGASEVLIVALAERGAFEEAHELLADAGERGPADTTPWEIGLRHSRARLALAEGDFERAHTYAREAGAARDSQGRPNPSRTPWRSTAALALAHLGRTDEAVVLADQELAAAERFGAPLPIATALHARAVADDDPRRRVELCERALSLAAGKGAKALTARLSHEIGTTLRKAGKLLEGREALRTALSDADEAGAVPLARQVRDELVATGLRPRRAATTGAGALTPRERQVCELAAVGKPNREIARQLFLSIKTVETHLAACYRKLEVAGRAQLSAALAA
jgi:DNA-binding CsgD family transcriptional regulator